MDDKAFQDLAKDALEYLKEKTVIELTENDLSYQESFRKHGKAEQRYMENRHLFSKEQMEIVEDFISASDENNTDMNDILYLAGLKDMLHLLCSYNLIKCHSPKIKAN